MDQWQSVDSLQSSHLEEQLSLLQRLDPALSKELRDHLRSAPLYIWTAEDGLPLFSTVNDSPVPPATVAGDRTIALRDAIDRCVNSLPPRGPRLIYCLGTGNGLGLARLLDSLPDDSATLVAACEDDPAILLGCLSTQDLRQWLSARRLLLLVGPVTPERLTTWLRRHALFRHAQVQTVVLPSVKADPRQEKANWNPLINVHRHEHRQFDRLVSQEERRLRDRDPLRLERFLLLDHCGGGLPQGVHIQSIRDALIRRGFRVEVVPLLNLTYATARPDEVYVAGSRVLLSMIQFQPDCLLGMKYYSRAVLDPQIIDRLPIPFVTYVTNVSYGQRGFADHQYLLVGVRPLVEHCRRNGAPVVDYLFLHANKTDPPTDLSGERFPVTFIGNPLKHNPDNLDRLFRESGDPKKAKAYFRDLVEATSPLQPQVNYWDARETMRPSGLLPAVAEQLWEIAAWEGTFYRRSAVLSRLKGLDLAVFGRWGPEEQRQTGLPADRFRGPLPLDAEASMFLRSDINLNIQAVGVEDSPNMRFMNVPGLGGFELSDAGLCLDQYFRDGEEAAFYRSEQEAAEKIEYYLAHPHQRREIAAAGRRRVLQEYTYDHWVDRFLKILRRRLTERYGESTCK